MCRFDRIESNRQHFQPTHSPSEVKIRKITIHEPSSFLKHGHKPQSIRTIRVDSIESTRIDNIFNPSSKSRSTVWNRVHESISGLSNRKYQRRIDSSWVYWTTLNTTVENYNLSLYCAQFFQQTVQTHFARNTSHNPDRIPGSDRI